jgi:hypothetical protein
LENCNAALIEARHREAAGQNTATVAAVSNIAPVSR